MFNKNYFTKLEKVLWSCSVIIITMAFIIFDKANYLTLCASIVGVTSLIFNAKGNPIGQILMIIFSLLYGIISYDFLYYGEMITYLGMTLPMSVIALISWLKHPYKGNKSEVSVNTLVKSELLLIPLFTAAVTFVFYFILERLNTANIVPSTISVATSFLAVYLTFRRSHYYAAGYAANDIVLIVLWTLASIENTRYISVIVCFIAFLINDIYGFYCWYKMSKRQKDDS